MTSSTLHRPALIAVGIAALSVPLLSAASIAGTVSAGSDGFTRVSISDTVSGAAFTAVGEIFPGEENVVTTGYGALNGAVPAGGGTLQVFRPDSSFSRWQRVEVFGAATGIIFPNRPTIADVDGDGLNDIIQPSGYFFDTDPAKAGGPQNRGALTWWRNRGLDSSGRALGFTRNDLLTGQGPSYHGVELVDLDADGIDDLVTTAEAANAADNQYDDVVRLQYLKGLGGARFAAPVTLAEGRGGSQPTVTDVDGDGRLDIVSSQYFNLNYVTPQDASFLWFGQIGPVGPGGGLTASNFEPHTIATLGQAGFGFQIQAVPDFREKGKVSWIGTNHQGRCFVNRLISVVMPGAVNVREMVMEFVPGADPTQPWRVVELSVPEKPAADPAACDGAFNVRDSSVLIHPTDEITARSAAGQAAPGVFGAGDIDGDGDLDLAVSGDGDRRLFWIEQKPGNASGTVLHTLTAPGETFGQSGGAVLADLDGDGRSEMIFSSFDKGAVAMWTRSTIVQAEPEPTPVPVPSVTVAATSLSVQAPAKRPHVGRKATWRVTLKATPGGATRAVSVSFRPTGARRSVKLRVLKVRPGTGSIHRISFTWRPKRAGTLTFTYAGGKRSASVTERASSATVKVRVRR